MKFIKKKFCKIFIKKKRKIRIIKIRTTPSFGSKIQIIQRKIIERLQTHTHHLSVYRCVLYVVKTKTKKKPNKH